MTTKTKTINRKKSVSLDTDVIDLIEAEQAQLADLFGFKPTVGQTLTFLLKKKVSDDEPSSD